jgi:hypothetical protein
MKPTKFTTMMMVTFSIIGLAMAAITAGVAAETFDLVILEGRVIDPETKLDAVRNVGVKDGKIAIIAKDKIRGMKMTTDVLPEIETPDNKLDF